MVSCHIPAWLCRVLDMDMVWILQIGSKNGYIMDFIPIRTHLVSFPGPIYKNSQLMEIKCWGPARWQNFVSLCQKWHSRLSTWWVILEYATPSIACQLLGWEQGVAQPHLLPRWPRINPWSPPTPSICEFLLSACQRVWVLSTRICKYSLLTCVGPLGWASKKILLV